ncbi:hypothetical protein DENSPDRAFT_835114 [Dentipellis sp. KUC8613]|nr:hypothetical protein DENSPDRAFT_835114 [Dentipellis sp. KUC8613]
MESPDPPPTAHTLRPHHISLLMIIMLVYKHYPRKLFHPVFLMDVYQMILHEVVEVNPPTPYAQLVGVIRTARYSDGEGAKTLIESLGPVYMDFVSVDHMTNFMHGISYLFVDTKGPHPVFARRSLLGYFCRRCFVSFIKLSYKGVTKLRLDYRAWLEGPSVAGYERPLRDLITYDNVLLKTHSDEFQTAVPQPYTRFENALKVADMNAASENVRQFFEQHFHDGNDSGVRQHALLNLSRMHYLNHEYEAARKFLLEGIEVSRTASDTETLQHCQSLLHRLPPKRKGQRQILNDIQPGLHPLEVLFDVEKLMRVSNEQPLSAAFEKIVQAIALYDHWTDVQGHIPESATQWSQHAVQSIVWSAAGCEKLAEIEENIVTAFADGPGGDNIAMSVDLNRAYRRARQGKYQEAIAMLLEPDVWRELSVGDLNQWALQIWHILVLRASRRGQDRQFAEFLRPRRPSGPFHPREYFFDTNVPLASIIRDPLYEVMQLKQVDQAMLSIEQLLKALWHSEFQCRYGSYRTGIILLADVGLEFGMTKRSRRILEEIMPQIIDGDNLEQRALACFTLARCIIAAGSRSQESIREALPYLEIAESDYRTLEMFRSLADVQYLMSVLYHNVGEVAKRDELAERHLKTEEERKKAAVVVSEDWIVKLWNIVCDIIAIS